MTLRLHNYELDENAYKVRLLLAFLDLAYEKVSMDSYPGQEHRSEAFLRISPSGELPVLEDGEFVLHQAEAILVYLARQYGGAGAWLPSEPHGAAEVTQWLVFAARDLRSASLARHAALFDVPIDETNTHSAVRAAFRVIEAALTIWLLSGRTWLLGDRPTIADIAVFPAFALARDFGFEHGEFPVLRRWARAFRHLPGFIPMPGVPDYH